MNRVLSFFLLFLALTGCHFSSPSSGKTLRMAINTCPTTWDPQRCSDFASSSLVCLLFEGLTRCGSDTKIELSLAQRIDLSPDETTYVFHLRPSVWSDGEAVKAQDFANAWMNALNPEHPSPCAYLFYPIENAENYVKGLSSKEDVGIHAIDPNTLVVKLSHPTPYFLSLTAFPTYRPSPSHVLKNDHAKVHNGPFSLAQELPQQSLLLKKNPSFWNAKTIELDQIHISIIPDEVTALRLFENQELDLLGGPLFPCPLDFIEKTDSLRFIPMLASTFCTFNTSSSPFSNPHLRKAFSLAIDREELFLTLQEMGVLPAKTFLPPALFNEALPKNGDEDPLELFHLALQELEMEKSDFQKITFFYKSQFIDKRLAQALHEQWQKRLGITFRIEQLDPKSLLQRLQEKNYDFALGSWIAQFDDPINILMRFKSKTHSKNYPVWEDEDFIENLDLAETTSHPQLRAKYLQNALHILEKANVVIPLYHWQSPLLVRPEVQNLCATSSGAILFECCRINPEPQSFEKHR